MGGVPRARRCTWGSGTSPLVLVVLGRHLVDRHLEAFRPHRAPAEPDTAPSVRCRHAGRWPISRPVFDRRRTVRCHTVRVPSSGESSSPSVRREQPRLPQCPISPTVSRGEVMAPADQTVLEFAHAGRPSSRPLLPAHRGPVPRREADTDEVRGSKGSVFYRAHSYHTKVPVEGLTRLVEHYTDPGDVIADPFCGSGQTGVAALLTGRHALISDLSPAAVHIATGYTTKVDAFLVRVTGGKVLDALADVERVLYSAPEGRVEYRVWSDVYGCPDCEREILFWDAGVDPASGQVVTDICCPAGHGPYSKNALPWLRSVPVQENVNVPDRRKRLVTDVAEANRSGFQLPRSDFPWHPTAPWESWREMWRGQHQALAIDTAADFYTDRNLYGLASLWHEINAVEDEPVRDALRFTFTAVVNRASRRYQWHPTRPTNVLSSTMYIAALNYEFNVFSLFRRKLSTISDLYGRTWSAPGTCEVRQGSATDLSWMSNESIDYVFTDPPFGSNIFYADSSFLWEAWLGAQTDVAAEAVVNKRVKADRGGTDLNGYESLMAESMTEIARVLRPNAWASLQFHNSDDSVWSSIQRAVEDAGFGIGASVVMDKGQLSFKGLRHAGKGEKVANFDLVMHLRRERPPARIRSAMVRDDVAAELVRYVADAPPSRRTTPSLHSIVMRFLLAENADLNGWSFAAVEELCSDLFIREGNKWALPQ